MMPATGQTSRDSDRRHKLVAVAKGEALGGWVLLVYLGCKAIFFALRINERIFPDEVSWFGLTRVFSRSTWLPADSPESYPFGLVTHVPSLYFFLMGKLLTLNVFPVSDLLFLRLANVGLGLLTVFFAWRLICLLTEMVTVRLLFLTMVTNTLMFTFLFGAVSYDNLVNLLSVMAVYYSCVFAVRREVMSLTYAVISVLAGCLTKVAFLPLAMLLAIVTLWRERRHLLTVPAHIKGIFSPTVKTRPFFALLVIVVMAGAGFKLYVGNWLRYSQIAPGAEAILSLEDALKYRIFARNYAVDGYKAGRLTLLDAQRLALQIREESDRQDTLNLLQIAQQEKERPASVPPRMGRMRYTVVWGKEVLRRTFGIMAHENMLKDGLVEMAPYYVLLGGGLVGFVVRLFFGFGGRPGLGRCGSLLFWLTAGYLVILMQFVNYQIYQATGFMDLALQGRYVFPVLVPAYILMAYYFVVAWPARLRVWSVAMLGFFFIYGEFPWFVRHASPDWFF